MIKYHCVIWGSPLGCATVSREKLLEFDLEVSSTEPVRLPLTYPQSVWDEVWLRAEVLYLTHEHILPVVTKVAA